MVVCSRCGRENPDGEDNCLRCGRRLGQFEPPEPPQEEPQHTCYRHKNIKTELSCGRCGRYLCHKCVVLGPAGTRCRDCARQTIALRPGAVVHGAKVGILNVLRQPFGWYIALIVLGLLSRVGCAVNESAQRARMLQIIEARQRAEGATQPPATDRER
jgi:ribosomal protein L40E